MSDGAQVARVLAWEVARVVRQLAERKRWLLRVWSRHRARQPILDTIFVRWNTATVSELAALPPHVLDALEAFYAVVEDLRLYVQFTEDMPLALEEELERMQATLEAHAEVALDALNVALPEATAAIGWNDDPEPSA
jgi:hypothetical protein